MKLIFGQLDQANGAISQHTAITLPWAIVKLSLYHLRAQVVAYEMYYGPIKITPDLIPQPPPLEPQFKGNPVIERIHEAVKKLHEEFVESLAAPTQS